MNFIICHWSTMLQVTTGHRLAGLAVLLASLTVPCGDVAALPLHPETAGTLVVGLSEKDRDLEPRTASDGGQVWSWSWGVLTTTPTAGAAIRFDSDHLSIKYSQQLEGFSSSGRVRFSQGRTRETGVVLLRDSLFTLAMAAGVVFEAQADTITVRPDPVSGDARAGIVMFLGIMLLTGLLLWNTRRRAGSS